MVYDDCILIFSIMIIIDDFKYLHNMLFTLKLLANVTWIYVGTWNLKNSFENGTLGDTGTRWLRLSTHKKSPKWQRYGENVIT